MRNIIGGLALISIVLSLIVGFSVIDPADAEVQVSGRIITVPYVQKDALSFMDGLKNGGIVIGHSLRMLFQWTWEDFMNGFDQPAVFGSVWLRKFWWLLGLPIMFTINVFITMVVLFKNLLLVLRIKGGIAYYLGIAVSFFLLLIAGYVGERDEPVDGPQATMTGA